ncbi:hypothetical protein PPRY_a2004 [Pseudoalteromonas prydzensis ACAM 620]|nr:hypothetical protein [Pseudoalteromonas prydzensis ACAM 620]MBE0379377.1 hypothetical protein [Pseudoalteromonas prydzensis ACAM 620]
MGMQHSRQPEFITEVFVSAEETAQRRRGTMKQSMIAPLLMKPHKLA